MRALRADRLQPAERFNQSLGKRLREVRLSLPMTQREVAGRTFLRPDLLSKYESGTHPPPVRSLHKIAQAVGKPVDCFLPELTFPEGPDRELYRFFRDIWFLPLESRRIIASVLQGIFAFQIAPAARSVVTGGPDAPRG
jgi:transcriptional regulator with XRE-family HTH domain